jgi:hypothetical protein
MADQIEKWRERLEDSGDDAEQRKIIRKCLAICRAPLSSLPMELWKFSDPAIGREYTQLLIHRRRNRVRDRLAKNTP